MLQKEELILMWVAMLKQIGRSVYLNASFFLFFISVLVFASNGFCAGVVLFSDNFDRTNRNLNGDNGWLSGDNNATGGDNHWAIKTNGAHAAYPDTLYYYNNMDAWLDRRNVSLSSYDDCIIYFDLNVRTEASWDYFLLNIKNQSGSWIELTEYYTGSIRFSGNFGWRSCKYNLGSYVGQTLQVIQLLFHSDGSVSNNTGIYVENFQITVDKRPTLTSGYVDPTNGYNNSSYTYWVKYTDADNDAPGYIKVYVDGTGYDMIYYSGSSSTGAWYYQVLTNYSRSSHNFYFSASDGWLNTTTSTISDPTVINRSPTLSSPSLSPSSGYIGNLVTTFDYRVNYSDADGDAPSPIYVYINGTPYPMSPYTGSTYRHTTTLSQHSNSYYFYCEDGYGGNVSTSSTSGPTITNRSPSIWAGSVTPSSGSGLTSFTYTVHYKDDDGDIPSTKRLYINSQLLPMSYSSGSYLTDATYTYPTTGSTWPIQNGPNSYSFGSFTDDYGGSSNTINGSGPTVTASAPFVRNGTVDQSTGYTSTIFKFTVDYSDSEGKAPTTKNVVIDGTNYLMTLESGSYGTTAKFADTTTLSAGSHNYYFSFSNTGGSDNDPNSGNYSGPTVHSYGSLSNSSVTPTSGNIETEFEYTITYIDADGDNPTTKNVKIDGTPYAMSYVSGSSSTGAVYSYKTKLSRSIHTYSYAFTEPDTSNITTSSYSGPTVQNRKPMLSNSKLSSQRSDMPSNFNFNIDYKDLDNDSPDSGHYIIIAQTSSNGSIIKSDTGIMQYDNGSYDNSAQYSYDTVVQVGYYKYQFYFIDKYGGDTRTDWFDGPTVGVADFEIDIDVPTNTEVIQGQQSSIYAIRVKSYSGFKAGVKTSVAMPSGVSGLTGNLSKEQIMSNDVSNLIIKADNNATPYGTYKITVTGTSIGMQPRMDEAPITLKYKSTIALSVSANKISKGEKISVSGTLSPAMSAPVHLSYYWKGELRYYLSDQRKNESKKEYDFNSEGTGNFRNEFIPDDIGRWEVLSKWNGNDTYAGDSEMVSFNVGNLDDIEKVKAGPIPANPEKGDVVRFFNVPSKSEVRIYTLSGKLVKILSEGSGDINVNESVATWNGKNTDNEMIASGIYYYMIAKDNKPLFDKPKKIVIIKK